VCIPYSQIFIEVEKEAAYIFLEKAVPMGYITLIAESADWVESELIHNNNNNTLTYIAPACRMTSEALISDYGPHLYVFFIHSTLDMAYSAIMQSIILSF